MAEKAHRDRSAIREHLRQLDLLLGSVEAPVELLHERSEDYKSNGHIWLIWTIMNHLEKVRAELEEAVETVHREREEA